MHLADVEGSARLVTYRAAFADWRCVCGEVGGRIERRDNRSRRLL